MALPTVSGEFKLMYDPEVRYGQSGTAVAKMKVVGKSMTKADDGRWREKDRLFIEVKVFGDTAENVVASLVKNDLVIVTGRLKTEEWTNQQGESRSRTMIMADEVGVGLRFRQTPHGQKAQESAQADAGQDPWATPQEAAQSPQQGAQQDEQPMYGDSPPF